MLKQWAELKKKTAPVRGAAVMQGGSNRVDTKAPRYEQHWHEKVKNVFWAGGPYEPARGEE